MTINVSLQANVGEAAIRKRLQHCRSSHQQPPIPHGRTTAAAFMLSSAYHNINTARPPITPFSISKSTCSCSLSLSSTSFLPSPSHLRTHRLSPHVAKPRKRQRRTTNTNTSSSSHPYAMSANNNNNNAGSDEQREWVEALEEILVEALRAYYQGTPLFSDAEFNTLRDELEHLGLSQVRLYNVEKVWMQATSARDFDRRMCQEFDLTEDDLRSLKHRLLLKGVVSKPSMNPPQPYAKRVTGPGSGKGVSSSSMGERKNVNMGMMDLLPWQSGQQESIIPQETTDQQQSSPGIGASPDDSKSSSSFIEEDDQQEKQFLADASELTASQDVNERIKWFLFSDASEERFKIMLIYLPAVVMSFVTASVLTILFALLDGEMTITVTNAGRFRLGILSYVAVMLTFWISNQFTPTVLEYLDLGKPSLMRGACPICGSSVSCLFTGAARVRDERKCSMCGATVAFNRRWQKTYLVSPPGKPSQSQPD